MAKADRPRQRALGGWLWGLVDVLAWVVCVEAATWLRFDFSLARTFAGAALLAGLALGVLNLAIGLVLGPYAVGHERGSFEEVVDLARTAVLTTAVAFVGNWLLYPPPLPRTVPLTSGALALGLMFAVRLVLRTWRHKRLQGVREQRRVIVFGAGEGGRQLVRAMLRSTDSNLTPVALLDDDPHKRRLRLDGVRVRGGRDDLAKLAQKYAAHTLAIAMPSAEASLVRDLTARADAAGLEVLILPPVNAILGARASAGDLRDLDLSDLLGRRPISLDTTAIAEQLSGRTVLVTGAGGSIGSELCRQIARFGPAKLFLLDRDESGLQATQLSLTGSGLLDGEDLVLADIRDPESLRAAFGRTRPEIVFHAAALKHLPLLEAHPLEAWKSNVLGTLNVLTAAAEAGVGTFVNISTDKAANPTCVLGYSKRVAERLTADFARREDGRYVSVRFGNVLGSRGSVVHAFAAQIERGGPITVTHPDVERYFMLIPEACQLVLEAASLGSDGEVMVLDMGEQVKIVEVARTLIRLSGRGDVEITYTGLRRGEKLREELFFADEDRRTTENELVSSVRVPALDAARIATGAVPSEQDAAWLLRRECMGGVVPETAMASFDSR